MPAHSNNKERKNAWRKENPKVENAYVKGGQRCFNNILQRCYNPKHPLYPEYGERGIRCLFKREEFKEFYFSRDTCQICGVKLNDHDRNMADGRTVDRIDYNGNYSKTNCRILCRGCNASRSRSRPRKM